jgi:hypothetical protein
MNRTADTNCWDIHTGQTGDVDSLFLKKNCCAVGFASGVECNRRTQIPVKCQAISHRSGLPCDVDENN